LGSFRKKPRGRFSPLLLWRLPKADTWAATVLVDELDARGHDSAHDLLGRLTTAAQTQLQRYPTRRGANLWRVRDIAVTAGRKARRIWLAMSKIPDSTATLPQINNP
jgi:hypothetical protein